jgi:[protein-PII] uridylyltransferase
MLKNRPEVFKTDFSGELGAMLLDGASGRAIVRRHAEKMDDYIRSLLPPDFGGSAYALFAVGGYGRMELAPHSDVDLMFYAWRRKDAQYLQSAYYRLVDSGFRMSHSARDRRECVQEARKDLTVTTSLMDARFIAGNPEAKTSFEEHVLWRITIGDKREFFAACRQNSAARHAKFGSSVYLLEPNVKESEGGLRDVHEALWLSRSALRLKDFDALSAVLSEIDMRRLERAYDFLLRVRTALHLFGGRCTDVLSFEYQKETARALGINRSGRFSASERLMRLYYLRARAVKQLCARVINACAAAAIQPRRWFFKNGLSKKIRLDENFSLLQNRITVSSGGEEKNMINPTLVIEAYLLASKHEKEFSGRLHDLVRGSLHLINKKVRGSSGAKRSFMEILRGGRVHATLRAMHDDGVLERFIPEFGSLRLLVVHEPYHIYTVDEHTLRAIAALEGLRNPRAGGGEPFREILEGFEDIPLLYLALLFHDVGKGRGRSHEAEGYRILKSALDRLELSPDAGRSGRELVEYLVLHHLHMARFAFGRDFKEPEVMAGFCEPIRDLKTLDALLLITYADMSAVNPEFLGGWKKTLLVELYGLARRFMQGIKEDPAGYILRAAQALGRGPEIQAFVGAMPARYLVSAAPKRIIEDFAIVESARREGFSAGFAEDNGTCVITVSAPDRPGLLADLVGALSARMLNIVSLRTFLADDGIVLDTIRVSNYKKVWWEGFREMLTGELRGVAAASKRPPTPKHRQKKRRFPPMIDVDNESSARYTVFETLCPDRLGLLYDITRCFSENSLDILMARVNTQSDAAQDVFYVCEKGSGLTPKTLQTVTAALWDFIR